MYSLMLKSHNDTAVAIAEHCGGTVEGFARMLNRKAKQIGCEDTYFITPNGLDAEDETGKHHTTAKDLALIMRYAIRNRTFLHIAQTRDYTFSEITGKRTFLYIIRMHFWTGWRAFLPEKQVILLRRATATCAPGKRKAGHLSSVCWGADGLTIKTINGVIQKNC